MIELFNRLGISVSYYELKREDMDLFQRILDRTGHRVPVPPSIISEIANHFVAQDFD